MTFEGLQIQGAIKIMEKLTVSKIRSSDSSSCSRACVSSVIILFPFPFPFSPLALLPNRLLAEFFFWKKLPVLVSNLRIFVNREILYVYLELQILLRFESFLKQNSEISWAKNIDTKLNI